MTSIPGTVKTDEKFGRYLEATRDIKQGETIITEDALIVGPSGDPFPFHICLGCYQVITASEPYECSSCKWPLCSEKCEKNIQHAKFECKVFKNAKLKPSNESQDYLNIKILRCLQLKEVNAKKYEQILSLESQTKSRKVAGKDICEFIHKKCNMKQFDTDIVGRMESIVAINSFATTDRLTMLDAPRMASLLFLNASMMSHDCVPNTSWVRVEKPDGTFGIKVWATVPIKKGEQITTQYMDITRATIERRAHLQDIYHFPCSCKRCSDPTELGTYYSAVKCTKCPQGKGYFLSTDPMAGADADWKCDGCGNTQPWRECAVPIETTIVGEIQAADNEEELGKLLEKHAGTSVHPNHYLMMDLRQEIVKRLFNSVASVKDEQERVKKAKQMVELCKPLVQVTNVFYPGFNRIKARLAYYTQYMELCAKGEDGSSKDLEKIEDVIREGKEMAMFD